MFGLNKNDEMGEGGHDNGRGLSFGNRPIMIPAGGLFSAPDPTTERSKRAMDRETKKEGITFGSEFSMALNNEGENGDNTETHDTRNEEAPSGDGDLNEGQQIEKNIVDSALVLADYAKSFVDGLTKKPTVNDKNTFNTSVDENCAKISEDTAKMLGLVNKDHSGNEGWYYEKVAFLCKTMKCADLDEVLQRFEVMMREVEGLHKNLNSHKEKVSVHQNNADSLSERAVKAEKEAKELQTQLTKALDERNRLSEELRQTQRVRIGDNQQRSIFGQRPPVERIEMPLRGTVLNGQRDGVNNTNRTGYSAEALQSLPRLKEFSGKREGKGSNLTEWTDWKARFRQRFSWMNDEDAVFTLGDFLNGEAKEFYLTIPAGIKGSLADCLKWMDDRMGNRSPYSKYELRHKFIGMREGSTGAQVFVEELEKIAEKIFHCREDKEEWLSTKVMSEFEKTPEQKELLSLMEKEASPYEKMKEVVVRAEYMAKYRQNREPLTLNEEVQNNRFMSGRCISGTCNGIGHKAKDCPVNRGANKGQQKWQPGPTRDRSPTNSPWLNVGGQDSRGDRTDQQQRSQCRNCGKMGHWSWDCWSNPQNQTTQGVPITQRPQNTGYQGQVPLNPNDTGGRKYVGALFTEEDDDKDSVFVGDRPIIHGLINGFKEKILVDTGANISIVPEQLIGRMKEVNMVDSVVSPVYDLSGNELHVSGTCIMNVRLEGLKPRKVAFHGVKMPLEQTILGMNAIPKFGLLRFKNVKDNPENQTPVNEGKVASLNWDAYENGVVWRGGSPQNKDPDKPDYMLMPDAPLKPKKSHMKRCYSCNEPGHSIFHCPIK